MEEPSDSSRQRAPDLTTFLVTSYEHLRLKTPLISRIHRARFKFRKVHEVELNFTSIEQFLDQDKKHHDHAHQAIADKLTKQGKRSEIPTKLWEIEHISPESNPSLFFHCSEVKGTENCITAKIQCWDTCSSKSTILHAKFTHELVEDGPSQLRHRHTITMLQAEVVGFQLTYRSWRPWIFLGDINSLFGHQRCLKSKLLIMLS